MLPGVIMLIGANQQNAPLPASSTLLLIALA